MGTDFMSYPVAEVLGIFRAKNGGFEPLLPPVPLTSEDTRRNPIFYILNLNPDMSDKNLIIDIIYDRLSPLRLKDLQRGTDIPRGVWLWPDWFTIPPYDEMHDLDGRTVYPRAAGIHTVQIRTACRKFAQMGRVRDFSVMNGGYTSPVFEFAISPGEQ